MGGYGMFGGMQQAMSYTQSAYNNFTGYGNLSKLLTFVKGQLVQSPNYIQACIECAPKPEWSLTLNTDNYTSILEL